MAIQAQFIDAGTHQRRLARAMRIMAAQTGPRRVREMGILGENCLLVAMNTQRRTFPLEHDVSLVGTVLDGVAGAAALPERGMHMRSRCLGSVALQTIRALGKTRRMRFSPGTRRTQQQAKSKNRQASGTGHHGFRSAGLSRVCR